MARRKIAIFTDVFLEVPGGIPSSISAQKKSLEALGYKVVVFCPGYRGTSVRKGIAVVPTMPKWLKINGAPVSRGPKTVEKWVVERYPEFSEFDMVHVHYEASCSIAGVRLARRFNIPLVQTMHGREDMAVGVNVPHPFKTLVGTVLNFLHSRYIPHTITVPRDSYLAPTIARAKMWTLMVNHANAADEVITPSKHFANKLKHYGVKKPIVVVSNGVSDELIRAFDVRALKKAKEEVISTATAIDANSATVSLNEVLVRRRKPGEPLKMIWNSRVSHEKRIMPFLRAIALMKEPVQVSVYGDGNAYAQAKRFIERKRLPVTLYGLTSHDKILDKMATEHLGVMASYGFDTQGLTLLESEATGLPVFYVDPDMREIVPRAGAVWSGPKSAEIARRLDRLARDPGKIESMSREMLQCRKEVFQSTQIKKLVDAYDKVIASRGRPK